MAPRADASKLTFSSGVYHRKTPVEVTEPAGVGKEICDAWREEHRRDATPEQIVSYYEALVQ